MKPDNKYHSVDDSESLQPELTSMKFENPLKERKGGNRLFDHLSCGELLLRRCLCFLCFFSFVFRFFFDRFSFLCFLLFLDDRLELSSFSLALSSSLPLLLLSSLSPLPFLRSLRPPPASSSSSLEAFASTASFLAAFRSDRSDLGSSSPAATIRVTLSSSSRLCTA